MPHTVVSWEVKSASAAFAHVIIGVDSAWDPLRIKGIK